MRPGRDTSQSNAETTQSLERMYTFNLSKSHKQAASATKIRSSTTEVNNTSDEFINGVPASEDIIDIRPIDMQ